MAAESSSSSETTTTTTTPQIEIQLTITAEDGSARVPLLIATDITATRLLQTVVDVTNIPSSTLKLIYRGRLIKTGDTVAAVPEYKLEHGSVIHCMGKPVKEHVAATTATSTSIVAPGTTLPSVSTSSTSHSMTSGPTTTSTTTTTTRTSSSSITNVTEAIANLRSMNAPDVAGTALTTLDKLLQNIITNPLEIKYRRIKKNNMAFGRRLGFLPGGHEALVACGFIVLPIDGEDQYELAASEESWNRLLANHQIVASAVRPPVRNGSAPATATGAFGTAGSMPNNAAAMGMPNAAAMANLFPPGMMMDGLDGGMPGMNSPEMQAEVQEFLSNPTQVQAMLRVRLYLCCCCFVFLSPRVFCLNNVLLINRIPWSRTCCVPIHGSPTTPWPNKHCRRYRTIRKPWRRKSVN
jgi:PUB domain/Ubiquitin family